MRPSTLRTLSRASLVAAVVVLTLIPASAYAAGGVVSKGVFVAGTDLSEMPTDTARAAIVSAVAPMTAPVTVKARGTAYAFDVKRAVTVNIEAMLAEAMSVEPSAGPEPGSVIPYALPLRYSIDTVYVNAFLNAVAKASYLKPRDAMIVNVKTRLYFKPSRVGAKLDVARARTALLTALSPTQAFAASSRLLNLPMLAVNPKLPTSKLGTSILISRSAKVLRLYKGTRLVRTYRVAVGMPRYPSPLGKWRVVSKQYMPSWYNPGSSWAAGMPRVIGPGPNNPLGTRALALNASGVLIHGTSKDYSIGTAASHGCIRMHRWDIERLYPQVAVGSRVWIVR